MSTEHGQHETINNVATADITLADIAPEPALAKKRPGRPRKNIENTPAEFMGIVKTPFNQENLVELVYTNPRLFKKINTLFKNYNASVMCIEFQATTATFMALDHQGKNTIYAVIDGNNLNHYHCSQPITIWAKRESIDKIFASLDKNFCKITFILRADYRSRFYILVHDIEYDSIDNYVVETICKPEAINFPDVHNDSDYPLKFVLSSKHFKKKISDISKTSESLTIIKEGDGPLQLTYDESKMINYNGVYPFPQKIALESRIAADDTFSVSVLIGYIKPFSNSNFGENVKICASKFGNLSLSTCLDKTSKGYAVEIKVFTEIKQTQ